MCIKDINQSPKQKQSQTYLKQSYREYQFFILLISDLITEKLNRMDKAFQEQCISNQKNIRKVLISTTQNLIIVATIQFILLYDYDTKQLLTSVKRIGSFRNMFLSPNQQNLVVTYSDNYCIFYRLNRNSLEQVLIILGISNDIKDIKFSPNSSSIIFGNHSFVHVHNLSDGTIEAHSQKFYSISAYCLGARKKVYLGKFSGDLHILQANNNITELKTSKIFIQCLVQVEELQYRSFNEQYHESYVLCASYKLEFSLVHIRYVNEFSVLVDKICNVGQISMTPLQRQLEMKVIKQKDGKYKVWALLNSIEVYNLQIIKIQQSIPHKQIQFQKKGSSNKLCLTYCQVKQKPIFFEYSTSTVSQLTS